MNSIARFVLRFSIVIALLVGAAWWLNHQRRSEISGVPEGVDPQQYQQAAAEFEDKFSRKPREADTLAFLAAKLHNSGDSDGALVCLARIPTDDPRYGIASVIQRSEILQELNRADEAEKTYRQLLKQSTAAAVSVERVMRARGWLVYLLAVELRFEERKSILEAAHETGFVDVYDSKQLFFPHLLIWNGARGRQKLEAFVEDDPQNRWFRIALARYRVGEGRLEAARKLLTKSLSDRAMELHRIAAQLEVEYESADWEAFEKILADAPDFDAEEPWLLTRMRGEWELHAENWSAAGRMFREVQRDDPAHPAAQMGLIRVLRELQLPSEVEAAQQRSLILSEIRVSLPRVNESDPAACIELAEKCDQINMPEAARQFRLHAVRIERSAADASPDWRHPIETLGDPEE